jgi:hypothetical protein
MTETEVTVRNELRSLGFSDVQVDVMVYVAHFESGLNPYCSPSDYGSPDPMHSFGLWQKPFELSPDPREQCLGYGLSLVTEDSIYESFKAGDYDSLMTLLLRWHAPYMTTERLSTTIERYRHGIQK